MKRWIGLAIGLISVGVLLWLAFFWRRPEQKTPQAQSKPAPNILVDLNQVKAFELESARGRVRFEKDDSGKWWITKPFAAQPDPLFFGGMLDTLSQTRKGRVVGFAKQDPLNKYGLERAYAVFSFEFEDGSKKTLRVGSPNPTMNYLYAWFEDEPDIFLIYPRIRVFLNREPKWYRFRRLVNITASDCQELKVIINDEALAEKLDTAPLKDIVAQATGNKITWILLEPVNEEAEASDVSGVLTWFERGSIAEDVVDLPPEDKKKWGLDNPRAVFEFYYPDRVEKVLVGVEKDGLVYVYQPGRNEVLGFETKQIYTALSLDFRKHTLLSWPEREKTDKVEVYFPRRQTGYKLVKLDEDYWAVDGDPSKKFFRKRSRWVFRAVVRKQIGGYINKRPIDYKKYGLHNPRIKVKYYTKGQLLREIWVGNWDAKLKRCYVYDPTKDIFVWYEEDLGKWFPPDTSYFLVKEEKKK